MDLFAGEEIADRRRLRWALAAAAAVHLAVLLVPVPTVRPPTGASAVEVGDELFRLREVRFAPPEPPAPVPAVEGVVGKAEEAIPPPEAEVEMLASGPRGALVPPRPLSTPPPPYPRPAWRRGSDAEVVLSLLVSAGGEVHEVTVEEGPAELAALAAEAARDWLFVPATVDGAPVAVGIPVRVRFPAPEEGPAARRGRAVDMRPNAEDAREAGESGGGGDADDAPPGVGIPD